MTYLFAGSLIALGLFFAFLALIEWAVCAQEREARKKRKGQELP